jgi:CheY-like chemotaxis protein
MTDVKKTLASINILVVDDMEAIRGMVKACLNHMGAEKIDTAHNGQVAYKTLSQRRYDLVVCDWDMPVMTGIELLQKLRASEQNAELPFLLLTASTEKSRVMEAVKAGVNDYLSKPFQPSQLEYRVIKLLPKILENKQAKHLAKAEQKKDSDS